MTKRNEVIQIRVTPEEKAVLEKLAAKSDLSVSDLIRKALMGSSPAPPAVKRVATKPLKSVATFTAEIDPADWAGVAYSIADDPVCDHAGTEIGKLSGVGSCPKCGKMVTKKEAG